MRPSLMALAFAALALSPQPGVQAAEPAKRFSALGHEIVVKLDRAATKGAYAVLELVDPPGMGPPRHVHSREDEIFYVIEGQLRIWRGEESFVAGPGSVVFMPRNVPHTFKNVGQTVSRTLVFIAPGRLQGFFEEASARKIDPPRDFNELVRLNARYGIKVLGPPPGGQAVQTR